MKKAISIIALTIMLAIAASSIAQVKLPAQESITAGSFSEIRLTGKTDLEWVNDTECYLKIYARNNDPTLKVESYGFTVQNQILTINDEDGLLLYELHADSSQVVKVTVLDNAQITFPDGTKTVSYSGSGKGLQNFATEMRGLIDEIVYTYDGIVSTPKLKLKRNNDSEKKRTYSVGDRTNFEFHWAFTNWGDKYYNGLMKMESPYSLRTSFSTYQLSENYAIVMTNHFKVKVGIGYESDVYKFTDNYVSMGENGVFALTDQAGIDAAIGVTGTDINGWSTRFVTRYVTMPIELEYRDLGAHSKFRMSIGVVPGLSFVGKHTGLKHEFDQKGDNYQTIEDLSRWLNPYKLDVRVTFRRKVVGVFLQMSTVPLIIDTHTKIYPIKIGFMI